MRVKNLVTKNIIKLLRGTTDVETVLYVKYLCDLRLLDLDYPNIKTSLLDEEMGGR